MLLVSGLVSVIFSVDVGLSGSMLLFLSSMSEWWVILRFSFVCVVLFIMVLSLVLGRCGFLKSFSLNFSVRMWVVVVLKVFLVSRFFVMVFSVFLKKVGVVMIMLLFVCMVVVVVCVMLGWICCFYIM